MNGLVSPRVSRALAVALLLFALWAAGHVVYLLAMQRWRLEQEIADAREQYSAMHSRRVELRSLREQLAALNASPLVRHAIILAGSDHASAARLQQLARKSIDDVKGKLIALTDVAAAHARNVVAVQVRARMGEPSLEQWLTLIAQGEPRLEIAEMTITSQGPAPDSATSVEITATLRGRWIEAEGAAQ